jgi:hypothetical protein
MFGDERAHLVALVSCKALVLLDLTAGIGPGPRQECDALARWLPANAEHAGIECGETPRLATVNIDDI